MSKPKLTLTLAAVLLLAVAGAGGSVGFEAQVE